MYRAECLPWAQLGLPMEKAQYIHRLGRTARAGKSGKGLIILGEGSSSQCWHQPQLGFCLAVRRLTAVLLGDRGL